MALRIYQARSRRGRAAIDRLAARGESALDSKILRSAEKIVRDVRRGGDRALLRAVRRFDGLSVKKVEQLRRQPRKEARASLPEGFEAALETAIASVEAFHRRQREALDDDTFTLVRGGLRISERVLPLRRVGLYVPGGRFPYPSSAVMTVTPARIAGVEEIVVVTPPQALESSPALRHTLHWLGVDEVWAMGGAHAIAALAYGTETIRPVDLIAGPGNAWVSAAKRLVGGSVGIDREAGPSEVVVVASVEDPGQRADFAELAAADLLAQAEHDPQAIAVLVTADRALARQVRAAVKARLAGLRDPAVARQSLRGLSCGLVVDDLEHGLELAEKLAPEHLQLIGAGAEGLAERVRCAGAIFVGAEVPTVLGDYVAGPSHVLPTGAAARFQSGLGVHDFFKRSHTVRRAKARDSGLTDVVAQKLRESLRQAAILARVEGLDAHRASAELRLGGANFGETNVNVSRSASGHKKQPKKRTRR